MNLYNTSDIISLFNPEPDPVFGNIFKTPFKNLLDSKTSIAEPSPSLTHVNKTGRGVVTIFDNTSIDLPLDLSFFESIKGVDLENPEPDPRYRFLESTTPFLKHTLPLGTDINLAPIDLSFLDD